MTNSKAPDQLSMVKLGLPTWMKRHPGVALSNRRGEKSFAPSGLGMVRKGGLEDGSAFSRHNPINRQWSPARRSPLAQESGQAAVETMFALVVLVILILVTVQLFFLADMTILTLNEAHRNILVEAHDLDGSHVFRRIERIEEGLVETIPGMQWALGYLGASDVQDSFTLQRSLSVYAGSFQDREYSIFAATCPFPACAKGTKAPRNPRMLALARGLAE